MSSDGTDNSSLTIHDAIVRQSSGDPQGWICPKCWNYCGGVRCKANVFIAFTGAGLGNCGFFDDEPKSRREAEEKLA